jgi:hypothetical protein
MAREVTEAKPAPVPDPAAVRARIIAEAFCRATIWVRKCVNQDERMRPQRTR